MAYETTKLMEDIGAIKAGLVHLTNQTERLSSKIDAVQAQFGQKISGLNHSIAGLVRQEDCNRHMVGMESRTREIASMEVHDEVREVTARHRISDLVPRVRKKEEEDKLSVWEWVDKRSKVLIDRKSVV